MGRHDGSTRLCSNARRDIGAHDPKLREGARLLVAGERLTATRENGDDPGTVQSGRAVVHDDRREKLRERETLRHRSCSIPRP
jgi:hypothetical protein